MASSVEMDFLADTPWARATSTPLPHDASARRYRRLTNTDGASAILSQDPSAQSRAGFSRISAHLRGLGLSAPEVLKVDDAAGFMLIEDLGDALYPKMIAGDPSCEDRLYSTAIDAILAASEAEPPLLDPLTSAEMAHQVMVVFDWYAGYPAPELEEDFARLFAQRLAPPDALMLRDVHAENLIWLPDRDGAARAGLLDFQDARQCSRLYDLVSLIEDARRDVPTDLKDALYRQAAQRLDTALQDTLAEAAVLSLQRNLRILGVFARLCLRDSKPSYLTFIPRVWGHIIRALGRIEDRALAQALTTTLPAPTPDHLATLEAECGKIQKR